MLTMVMELTQCGDDRMNEIELNKEMTRVCMKLFGHSAWMIDEYVTDKYITIRFEFSNKRCDMCGEYDESVGLSGCDHEAHQDIRICELCDIDGSQYNGWCE